MDASFRELTLDELDHVHGGTDPCCVCDCGCDGGGGDGSTKGNNGKGQEKHGGYDDLPPGQGGGNGFIGSGTIGEHIR